MLDANYLTATRTGAAAGVATRYLAPCRREQGWHHRFGSGGQYADRRGRRGAPGKQVRVYSRSPEPGAVRPGGGRATRDCERRRRQSARRRLPTRTSWSSLQHRRHGRRAPGKLATPRATRQLHRLATLEPNARSIRPCGPSRTASSWIRVACSTSPGQCARGPRCGRRRRTEDRRAARRGDPARPGPRERGRDSCTSPWGPL